MPCASGPSAPASAAGAPLDVARLRAARAGRRIGGVIEYFACLESTNDRARALGLDGAPEGTVVIAERQTRGRGRLGRSWVSPPHVNLYLSVVLRPAVRAAAVPQLALVAGLATCEAVQPWAPAARLKWPNDVVVGGRKLAGMLAELETEGAAARLVILGIGLNVNSGPEDFPPGLRDTAIALREAAGGPVDRVAVAAALLDRLETRYAAYADGGFAALRRAWEALSCLGGRRVRVAEGGQTVEGVVIGLADDGALRVRDAGGTAREVRAGDVTLVGGYAGLGAGEAT